MSVLIKDHVERGDWTPVLSDAITGGNTATFFSSVGKYTKTPLTNGSLVNVFGSLININTAGMTAGNPTYIQDLPFFALTEANFRFPITAYTSLITFTDYFSGDILNNNNVVELASGNFTNILVSQYTSGAADIYFQATYITG